MNTDVQTIDYCSPIDKIQEKFNSNCIGKDNCELTLEINEVFDKNC